MTLDLNEDEINLLLSAVGGVLDMVAKDEPELRAQLEALQTKLMAARDEK